MSEQKTEAEILDDLRDRGIAESAKEIPFEKCQLSLLLPRDTPG
ncbi:hypothetical protein [Saliphagus infecundisoli]|uniref:Uncharacterized protein n=1 Tax=Saliphagus infecundisoli TaxID=1849069 RepID=A0ABD5Q976_9EURY|nr:hypothetical protein [Saliphagus infecundisoli]